MLRRRSAPTVATTNILDNDAATSISIAADAASINEEDGTITFTVTRTGDAEGSQSVSYALIRHVKRLTLASAWPAAP